MWKKIKALFFKSKVDRKEKTDGICSLSLCQKLVPSSNLNLFYCSEQCRRKAWKIRHPGQEEPDWNREKLIFMTQGSGPFKEKL